ncbi:MAG: chloride channel protein [Lachnospiraceae bacterium]|nr:chloride channel protein [Lachnospiraceae bacterium]
MKQKIYQKKIPAKIVKVNLELLRTGNIEQKMKKEENNIRLYLFILIMGGAAGAVIWIFLKAVSVCTSFIWKTVPSYKGLSLLPLLICVFGGAVTGILHKKFKNYPEDLTVIMDKIKNEKYYPYQDIIPMLLCAFIPLICCSSVGPEAGLTGIIAALCYWVGDNITYAKSHSEELSEIGEAVTLGQLFRSPLFGIFEVEESEDPQRDIKTISKGYKLLYYGLSTAASFMVISGLNSIFGKSMEGFPSFSDVEMSVPDFALLIIYIPIGLLLFLLFVFFEKLTENIGSRVPVIAKEIICGTVIGIMGIALPMVMSSGEEQMGELMETYSGYAPVLLVGVCILKLLMTTFCINFGMKGGHFFPLIFACTCMGLALSMMIFEMPEVHAPFAAAAVTATVLGASLKKPVAASFLLLLCFPAKVLLWTLVCATIGSKVSDLIEGKLNKNREIKQ